MNKQGANGIPYCDYTWNPVTGCLHTCTYCFARRITERFKGTKAFPGGFAPTFHEERLAEPKKIKKPSRIFVSDMGDLFGDWVPEEHVSAVLKIVRECPQHTFLFLTKNPKRYQEFEFPPNAWLGTSVENQATADERIPLLLQIPAAVRFISAEPLLGPISLTELHYENVTAIDSLNGLHGFPKSHAEGPKLDWVICGSESGAKRRPAKAEWIRDLKDQCASAGVPFFFKQMDINGELVKMPELDGQTWDEMPG